jgi:hypothetical protein
MWLKHFPWIVIIFCKTASSQIGIKNATVEESVQRFLADNGFKYITLIENSTVPSVTRVARTIAEGGTLYMRAMSMTKYLEKYTLTFLDTQVFIVDAENDNTNTFLHLLTRAPIVRSSVICIKSLWSRSQKARWEKSMDELELDSLFYLVVSTGREVPHILQNKNCFNLNYHLYFSL